MLTTLMIQLTSPMIQVIAILSIFLNETNFVKIFDAMLISRKDLWSYGESKDKGENA